MNWDKIIPISWTVNKACKWSGKLKVFFSYLLVDQIFNSNSILFSQHVSLKRSFRQWTHRQSGKRCFTCAVGIFYFLYWNFNSFLQSLNYLCWQTYVLQGDNQLLEIWLLEKTGQHNFSTAWHHSSKCHFFVNWSNPVYFLGSTGFEQFHF